MCAHACPYAAHRVREAGGSMMGTARTSHSDDEGHRQGTTRGTTHRIYTRQHTQNDTNMLLLQIVLCAIL